MSHAATAMWVGLLLLPACRVDSKEKAPVERTAKANPTPAPSSGAKEDPPELPTRFADAKRIVALGDLHGDLDATRRALRLAGAIGEANDSWVGGDLVLVQTGDQLDRGDDERDILALLDRLQAEAKEAGGAVHVLNGNHEYMNVAGDFRYVTPGGQKAFADLGRGKAFAPGGTYAKVLGRRNTVVIVGETVFVHGGVEPKYAKQIDAINRDARRWLFGLEGKRPPVAATLMSQDSPIWSRAYSEPTPTPDACAALTESLRSMNATRMVVGHTVQKTGITSACDDKVWRIDVGMAKHYGGTPAALEIQQGEVKVLN